MSFVHVPVLEQRCLELLAPAVAAEGAVLVDATLGLGGHSESALVMFPGLRLVGLDRDPQALAAARTRLARFSERVTLVHAVYDRIVDVLTDLGIRSVQGVLFDLGVSSMQLDDAQRGFAYAQPAPLDMRMDPATAMTAADVLNTYDERELARVLRVYGEERFAGRIAKAIVRERAVRPLQTSEQLVALVRAAIPAATRRTGGNPAKRTFQALRIEVNDELAVLRRAIPAALDSLAVGGRIVVLSYHSLEDKIVKAALRAASQSTTLLDLPFLPEGDRPWLELIASHGPSDDEIVANPRAASVRLRAAQRVAA